MGDESWINRTGDRRLTNPWPNREPVHGAHYHTRPTRLILDGRQLRVTYVHDIWSIWEPPDHISTGWEGKLENGQQVVVVHWQHERWFLAR